MISKNLKSLLVLVAVLMAIPVWAGEMTIESKIDIGKLTCKELMRGNDGDREIGIAFYHGFLAGKKNEQTIDLHGAYSLTDRVKDFCLSNPTETVMDAFAKSAN